jgi:hypothetical protein
VGIPILVLIPASLSSDTQAILGDLYAFGLLGAFSVTCLSLDIVRWREQRVALGAGTGPAGQGRPGHGVRVVQNVVRVLRRGRAHENRPPLLTRLNGEDRVDRALRLTGAAVDALVRVDVVLLVVGRVDAVDGADGHAIVDTCRPTCASKRSTCWPT